MTAFVAGAALLFFVLGSLALALPWCGIVHLVERMPGSSEPAPHRYALLLAAPVVGLVCALSIALGPCAWDSGIGKALHEGCLHQISRWNLPPGLAALVGASLVLILGRLAWAYGIRRFNIRPASATGLDGRALARWQAVSAVAERLTGMRPPRLIVVDSPGVCALRGALRPTLFIDAGLLQDLEYDEFVGVVCHELAHLRRRDLFIGPLLHLCYCLLSFFPAARHCYARYLEERELAADAWAIRRTRRPLALASAIVKAGQRAGSLAHAELRVSRLMGERGRPEPAVEKASVAWALALVPLMLAALAGPNPLAWHRLLERFGRDVLLAVGVLD